MLSQYGLRSHLFELDDIWMNKGSVVDKLPLHILVDLSTHKELYGSDNIKGFG